MANLFQRMGEIAGRYGLANLYVFGSRGAELAARVRAEAPVAANAGSDADPGAAPVDLSGGGEVTASRLRSRIVAQRAAWVREMLEGIRALPLDTFETFQAAPRDAAAAAYWLRRAREALVDLGRHVLAKGLGTGVDEYEEVAAALARQGVL